jgi:hypothetical protein
VSTSNQLLTILTKLIKFNQKHEIKEEAEANEEVKLMSLTRHNFSKRTTEGLKQQLCIRIKMMTFMIQITLEEEEIEHVVEAEEAEEAIRMALKEKEEEVIRMLLKAKEEEAIMIISLTISLMPEKRKEKKIKSSMLEKDSKCIKNLMAVEVEKELLVANSKLRVLSVPQAISLVTKV